MILVPFLSILFIRFTNSTAQQEMNVSQNSFQFYLLDSWVKGEGGAPAAAPGLSILFIRFLKLKMFTGQVAEERTLSILFIRF